MGHYIPAVERVRSGSPRRARAVVRREFVRPATSGRSAAAVAATVENAASSIHPWLLVTDPRTRLRDRR